MKFISIIVCHFSQTDAFGGVRAKGINRSEMMKESLESLFENTDYPAEVIVLDNGGSPDDTEWLAQKVREGKINTLVRYKENMNFAFAWNQGFRLATGDYVCFTCNDIKYHKNWASTCIGLLEKNQDRKLIAAPMITPDKDNWHYNKETLEDGSRINSLAGSNCFILTPEIFKEIGEMPHHRIGGSIWHRRMHDKGYRVIVPKENIATHLAHRGGTNYKLQLRIERVLLQGEKINYTYDYQDPAKDYLYGKQKNAGIKL